MFDVAKYILSAVGEVSTMNVHKGHFSINKGMIPNSLLSKTGIPIAHKNYIDSALEKYGKMDGDKLSALAHSEKPWQDAIKNVNSARNSSNVISHQAIIEFGKKLKFDFS